MSITDQIYNAPWSRTLKIMTHSTNVFLIGLGLAFILLGSATIRDGQAEGWVIVGSSLTCWLTLLLAPVWAPKRYRIADSAVVVDKRMARAEELPFSKMASIEIRDCKEVFRHTMRFGSGGYYGFYGHFWGGVLGAFRALVTNDGPVVVIRMKKGDPVVLSPEKMDEFTRELSRRANILIEEVPSTPSILFRPPLTTGQKVMELLALVFLVLAFLGAAYYWDKLPETIPSHFDISGKPDGWGPKSTIWIGPISGLVLYVILTVVTFFTGRMNRVSMDHPRARKMVDMTRWLCGLIKCEILALMAYVTWQIPRIALGQTRDLGVGFFVILMFVLLLEPAPLIVMGVYLAKSDDE